MSDAILHSTLLWTLVAAQIAMGGFDVIVHHELSERLAWKNNAADELRLHAWRNVFYAVLFATFAFTRPTGWLAIALLTILVVEIGITLWDFVEEDMTRRLPPSERVLHTLLAINYGAIMAVVAPQIVHWASEPTGLGWVNYGWGSAVLAVGSIGVMAFAMRDFYTSRRARAFAKQPVAPAAADLGSAIGPHGHVLVTGGTGLVGSHLVAALVAGGHRVTVLTRSPAHAAHLATPVTLVTDLDQIDARDQIDAVVNLAGASIAGWIWTRAYRRKILASRLRTIRAIGKLVDRLETPPSVIVGASAVGYYGARGDEVLTEADKPGTCREFTARVCKSIEAATGRLSSPRTRAVMLRIGLVLDRDGGLLARMLPAFDLGLGGPIGSGRQWMSWIAVGDLVRLIAFAISDPRLEGAVNATAPQPVRNARFAAVLGEALARPAVIPVPAWPLRLMLGAFAEELLLSGQRVLPAKAEAAGFRFDHQTIDQALDHAIFNRSKPEQTLPTPVSDRFLSRHPAE